MGGTVAGTSPQPDSAENPIKDKRLYFVEMSEVIGVTSGAISTWPPDRDSEESSTGLARTLAPNLLTDLTTGSSGALHSESTLTVSTDNGVSIAMSPADQHPPIRCDGVHLLLRPAFALTVSTDSGVRSGTLCTAPSDNGVARVLDPNPRVDGRRVSMDAGVIISM